jgi:hypothetical protein
VIQSFSAFIGLAVAMITCLAAMVLGGAPERFAGAMLLVINFADLVVQSHSDWIGPQYAVLVFDATTLAVALAMVLKTDRAWTVGFAAYQALTCLTHVVILFEPAGDRPELRTWVYITGLIVWGYLIWVCLAWGTYTAWRDRERLARNQDASSGRNAQGRV